VVLSGEWVGGLGAYEREVIVCGVSALALGGVRIGGVRVIWTFGSFCVVYDISAAIEVLLSHSAFFSSLLGLHPCFPCIL